MVPLFRTRCCSNAVIAVLLLPVTLLATFRSVDFVNVAATTMKTRLALALLVAIVTALPASGGADRWPSEEQRSRQPYGPGRVLPDFPPPPPTAPPPEHVPELQPSPYGAPGALLPLPLPYQRPWVN